MNPRRRAQQFGEICLPSRDMRYMLLLNCASYCDMDTAQQDNNKKQNLRRSPPRSLARQSTRPVYRPRGPQPLAPGVDV